MLCSRRPRPLKGTSWPKHPVCAPHWPRTGRDDHDLRSRGTGARLGVGLRHDLRKIQAHPGRTPGKRSSWNDTSIVARTNGLHAAPDPFLMHTWPTHCRVRRFRANRPLALGGRGARASRGGSESARACQPLERRFQTARERDACRGCPGRVRNSTKHGVEYVHATIYTMTASSPSWTSFMSCRCPNGRIVNWRSEGFRQRMEQVVLPNSHRSEFWLKAVLDQETAVRNTKGSTLQVADSYGSSPT